MDDKKVGLIIVECCYNCRHWANQYFESYRFLCKIHNYTVLCDNKCDDYEAKHTFEG